MKYASANGHRVQATPKGRGECPSCGEVVIAKCGTKVVWHWAHTPRHGCDAWWEPETEWHRDWKNKFPEDNQEVVQFDDTTGEKHIADVRLDNGTVIEFQNSPISSTELLARENFYECLVWIVNGQHFESKFEIGTRLPNPLWASSQRMVFSQLKPWFVLYSFHGIFPACYHERHFTSEIADQIDEHYVGHHVYDWEHPRSVWYEARKPVLIDFGGPDLWWLKDYDTQGLRCVQSMPRDDFFKFVEWKLGYWDKRNTSDGALD